MTKVLIIPNGFQRQYTKQLVTALNKTDTEIWLPSSDLHRPDEFPDSVTICPVGRVHDETRLFGQKALDLIRYYFSLITFILRSNIDLVHFLWLRFPAFEGIVLVGILRLAGRRVVLTVHDALPHHRQDSRFQRALHWVIYRSSNSLAVHSSAVASILTGSLGLDSGRVRDVGYAVYDAPESDRISTENARLSLGIDPGQRTVLFFGYVRPYKGLDTALRAVEQLDPLTEKPLLLIAGDITNGYRQELNSLFRIENRPDVQCRFGYIPDEDVPLLFQAADAVLLPYREDSLCSVMYMAWSWGCPVLASKAGTFPQEVEVGRNGLLFDTDSEEEMARCIREGYVSGLLTDRRLREQIHASAKSRYSWERVAGELHDWYQGVIGGK